MCKGFRQARIIRLGSTSNTGHQDNRAAAGNRAFTNFAKRCIKTSYGNDAKTYEHKFKATTQRVTHCRAAPHHKLQLEHRAKAHA